MATSEQAIQSIIDLVYSLSNKGGLIEVTQGQNRARFESIDALSRAAARIADLDAGGLESSDSGCIFEPVGVE